MPPSKPFVAPDMLVGSPETEGPESQVTACVSPVEYEAHWHIPRHLTTNIQSMPALQALLLASMHCKMPGDSHREGDADAKAVKDK